MPATGQEVETCQMPTRCAQYSCSQHSEETTRPSFGLISRATLARFYTTSHHHIFCFWTGCTRDEPLIEPSLLVIRDMSESPPPSSRTSKRVRTGASTAPPPKRTLVGYTRAPAASECPTVPNIYAMIRRIPEGKVRASTLS